MLQYLTSVFALATAASAAALRTRGESNFIVTPHQQFSSSMGVLGCMINTDRVAYFPTEPTYDDICIKLTLNGRSVNLLKIDHSEGAHDISYDAFVYLTTGGTGLGNPGHIDPTPGGSWVAQPLSECADLIHTADKKIPLIAASPNFYFSVTPAQQASFEFWNIVNSQCTYGYDEKCYLPTGANQLTCPHITGAQPPLTTMPVYNIDVATGKKVLAV